MEKRPDLWQRFSGYLVVAAGILLLIAVIQLFGLNNLAAGDESAVLLAALPPEGGEEVEIVAATAVTRTTARPAGTLPILNDTSLAPILNPHTYQAKMPTHNFKVHIVTELDTPNSIALEYGITADTIIGGNPDISRESNLLQTGAELVILPVDGVLHTVRPGETLDSIADLYGVSVDTIIGFPSNNLEPPFLRLLPESQLVIPGASLGQFTFRAPKSVGNSGGEQQWAVVGTGIYLWPVDGRCLTQYYSGFHPGIDISTAEGSAVYASDTGTVTYAAYAAGIYYDYGNLIVINHGNGFETFYAHLSGINVYPGQIIYQGDYIGSTGNTGRSSGPHIHFEIRSNDYGQNPLNRLAGPVQSCS